MSDIRTGDIVAVCLDPAQDDEMKKTRPCLILEGDGHQRLELVIVVPITNASEDKKADERYIFLSRCGLPKPSVIDTYQIRCLSSKRLGEKIGRISTKDFDKVRSSLALILRIEEKHII